MAQEAMIYNFDGSTLDCDGDTLLGYYYQLIDVFERPISELMGPYSSASECQTACQEAYDHDDY